MAQSATSSSTLRALLAGCRRGERAQQQQLYRAYYSYALSICLRYTRRREEAVEVVNDGFLKIFRDLGRFDLDRYDELDASFRGWLKRVMIHTAIDCFRAQEKHQAADLADLSHEPSDPAQTPLDQLAYDELLRLVQQLPAAYRTVFSLFAVDGYSHEEIAQQLGITAGTSKSNLFKARAHLQHLLKKIKFHAYANPIG